VLPSEIQPALKTRFKDFDDSSDSSQELQIRIVLPHKAPKMPRELKMIMEEKSEHERRTDAIVSDEPESTSEYKESPTKRFLGVSIKKSHTTRKLSQLISLQKIAGKTSTDNRKTFLYI